MKRKISTCFSPELINLYEINEDTIVVVIDVLRATSTIAALIHMGVSKVIPVNSIQQCIDMGINTGCITAGERNGKVIPGLDKGNSPLAFEQSEVMNRAVALTTTNGTMLLNELLLHGATHIVTGAFVNISAVCQHILDLDKSVMLACAGWKGFVNCEDSLFAGAVAYHLEKYGFEMCDSSIIAKEFYKSSLSHANIFEFMAKNQTSHFQRLTGVGHEDDLEVCCETDRYPCLPFYQNGALVGI